MRILITGASGFIGHAMCQFCVERGHEVVGLARSPRSIAPGTTFRSWELGQGLPDGIGEVQAAVHLAHDFTSEIGAQRTVEGTLRLVRELSALGASRQIYVSSYSAGEHGTSVYARTKTEIERRLAPLADVSVVRPGLVLGGGLHARIADVAQRFPVVPLPAGGSGLVPVIPVGELCGLLLQRLQQPRPANDGPQVLCESHVPSLKEVVMRAAAEKGKRPWIFPVPARLVLAGLRVAEIAHLKLPVNADNLRGFLANQNIR